MKQRTSGWRRTVGLVALAVLLQLPVWAAGRCAICNGPFGLTVYRIQDEWTQETRVVCETCAITANRCSVCRMPVLSTAVATGDGRFLCPRDAAAVVLDDEEVRKTLEEARKEMDRMFSRFTSFPGPSSLDFALVDHQHMQELLDTPSFDRQCPYVMGYTSSKRDAEGRWAHTIRLLRARPRAEMVGVYAHELSHAWAREHVPADRRMKRDAEEGFCELVASRVLEQLGERDQVARVFRNNYTRGQIQLFQKAYEAYEFNVVLDWMRYGADAILSSEEPDRVRRLELPVLEFYGPPVPVNPSRVRSAPPRSRLTLVGVLGGSGRRRALVNDIVLGPGETGVVRLGTNQVDVRCVSVGTNSVVLEISDTGETLQLELGK